MKKILAIDDQKDNLTTIKAVIKSNIQDCDVILALSGEEGMKLANETQPDVILLDIIMPGLDGYEVCQKLKADNETKHIPVILITAIKTDSSSRIKGLNMGADAFLSKPIDPFELSAQVNVMLRIKKAEDDLRFENEKLEKIVTERTQKLAESEEKYKALYSNAPLPYQALNEEGEISDVNPAWLQMLGYKRDEVIGKWYGDFLNPHSKAIFKNNFPVLKQCGTVNDVPFQIRHKDNHFIYISLNGASGYYPDGKFKQTYCVFQDITKQKKATEALKESEQKLRLMIENSPIGVSTTDLSGLFIDVNSTLCDIIGYSKSEMLGKHFNTFSYPEDVKKNELLFEKLVKGEVTFFELEKRYIHKTGKIVNVFIRSQLIRNEEGEPLYQTAIIEDVTEQKRAEQIQKVLFNIAKAVITTENLDALYVLIHTELSSIIDTTNFHIALYDSKTDLISLPFFINKEVDLSYIPKGKTLTRYLVNKKHSLLIYKEDLPELRKSNQIRDFEKDPEIWLGVPLSVNGELTGALVVQSYDNRNAFNKSDMEMLEFVSDQISQAIHRKKAEEDLINALKKANESDRLKSAFLATMSHELRTPLNAIIGFSEFLDESLPMDDVKKFGEIINSSGTHLLSIVNDLFDITLIESGETVIRKDQVNLNSLVNDVKNIIEAQRQRDVKKDVDFKIHFPLQVENLQIVVDSNKLKQILINLLKNAFKFTEKGSVCLGVELETSNDEPYLELYVRDTGIGIAENKQDIIFDIFRQVEDTTIRKYGGTGIGLSVAKRLTELLGGRIWIESKEGEGSTFYVEIPYVKAGIITKTYEKVALEKIEKKGNSILVAEDDEPSFFFIKVVLDKLGMDIIWAKNGEDAIRFCKENSQICIVLMDINMPILDGYQATKQIKEFRPSLPIIAQTAYAVVGDREKSLLAGCNDYVSKPINREILVHKIRGLLNGKKEKSEL